MTIPVPPPPAIHAMLFSNPPPSMPILPSDWGATFLLTPFGGMTSPLSPSDQLVVARVTYHQDGTQQQMRTRLYLLESNLYYDFLFVTTTATGVTQWWWFVSDPSAWDPAPTEWFGPFDTTATTLREGFLPTNDFSYIGTWRVVGSPCDTFVSPTGAHPAGTFYTFDAQTANLRRIMNVGPNNDYAIAVLGAYYFANATVFESIPPVDLGSLIAKLKASAKAAAAPSPMLTLLDVQTAMMSPPAGAFQIPCTLADIKQFIPGISFPTVQPEPPAWSNQVQSFCWMIGQDTYPYYSQVYYDWDLGKQISLFVTQSTPGVYDAREDDVLPKGVVGPSITYDWQTEPGWVGTCMCPQGGFMPMSVPNFVEVGGGLCRAVFTNDPYFGNMTMWSIALDDMGENGNFWDWFDDQQNGVVFSLAPAKHLTLIDYQTFLRNAVIDPTVWDEPTPPQCSDCGPAKSTLTFRPGSAAAPKR